MKKLFCIIFGLLVSTSCTQKKMEAPIEKLMFNFENHLIQHQILKDNKDQSYRQLLQEISQNNNVNYKYQFSFIDSLETNKKIDVSDYLRKQKSLIYTKALAFEALMNGNTEKMDLHTALVAERILSVTEPTDFEHNYFKLQFFLFLDLANINN